MTIDPNGQVGQFIQQPWVAYPVMIGFALLVLCLIAGAFWYWPGDDSCMAAQWQRHRAAKSNRDRNIKGGNG